MIKNILILIFLFSQFCFVNAQFPVSRIYSDFGGFWQTPSAVPNNPRPDNSHNLLAFTWDSDGSGPNVPVTYSTGVSNGILNSNGVTYTPATFISLPVYQIPAPGGDTFIGVGQKYGGNGNVIPVPVNNNLVSYLSDGINGLDLGTAIFNIPQGANISFNTLGIVGASVGDGVPDLLFTQMGAVSGTPDSFRFVDSNGLTVGTPYSVAFNNVPIIGEACWKFYNANVSPPAYNSGTSSSCTREIRILALDWSELGINAGNYQQAVQLRQTFSGTSDVAFTGTYNGASITFLASVTGSVFNDNNGGTPDGNGYAGATVSLLNNGTVIRTAVTDAFGNYFFDNINTNTHQGPYTIQLTVPSGFSVVGNKAGTTSNSFNTAINNSISAGNNFGINQPPVAINDIASVGRNIPKTFSISSNDYDPNSGTLNLSTINLVLPAGATLPVYSGTYLIGFTIVSQGRWLVNNTNGNLTFTPANNFYGNATTVSYTVRDGAGLTSNTATITIAVDYCTKPMQTGTPDGFTKVGISNLNSSVKNWPEGPGLSEGGIPNGHLALESKTQGLVITRVANSNLITEPKKGMIIYDRAANCIKLYNGAVWNCIKRTCNE